MLTLTVSSTCPTARPSRSSPVTVSCDRAGTASYTFPIGSDTGSHRVLGVASQVGAEIAFGTDRDAVRRTPATNRLVATCTARSDEPPRLVVAVKARVVAEAEGSNPVDKFDTAGITVDQGGSDGFFDDFVVRGG